jgi:hypothetical protein
MTEILYIACLPTERPTAPLGCSCLRSLPLHGFCFGCSAACDRSCRPTDVCPLLLYLGALSIALFLVSSALRSLRLSPAFFATMASADSLPALTGKVSPGKVTGLSAHAAGLYPPRFFDSLRTSRSLARSSPVAGLSVRSSSCGRAFAFRCFHPDGGTCGSATVVAIDPDELLSFHKSSPMLGTREGSKAPPMKRL